MSVISSIKQWLSEPEGREFFKKFLYNVESEMISDEDSGKTIRKIKKWLSERRGRRFLRKYILNIDVNKVIRGKRDNNMFFYNCVRIVFWIFASIGFVASVLIYYSSGDIFKAIAVFFLLIWLLIFLRYFLWAVYHYNVNNGLSEEDWEKIEAARERFKKGLPVLETEIMEPEQNPYRSQTFGLPPGTVRGMIAFTLLFGAITILIATMGMNRVEVENSMLGDQFEFFKTAFLMMIAFYFGDKSLRYLQKRWKDPNKPVTIEKKDKKDPEATETLPDDEELMSPLDIEDQEFEDEEKEYAAKEDSGKSSRNSKIINLLNAAVLTNIDDKPKSVIDKVIEENKFVERNIYKKIISDEEIRQIITDLKEKENIDMQFPVLKAIIEIESGGRGHLEDGRTKILFEGHKFWYWLKEAKKSPEDYVKDNEDILYEKWTKKFYKGGPGEYLRLNRAMQIDKKAAVFATSWGLFQILGENLTNNLKSRINPEHEILNDDLYSINIDDDRDNLNDFLEKQEKSERYHLLDFLAYIKTKKVDNKPLISYVAGNNADQFNWEKFAYGYNGPGYKTNKYDIKLKNAYNKYLEKDNENQPAIKVRVPIIDAGFGGIDVNGTYLSPEKKYKFIGQGQNNLEILAGDINRKIAQKLIEKLKAENISYIDIYSASPKSMPIEDMVKAVNLQFEKNKSYYYLGIHCNSASNDTEGTGTAETGFEIYTSIGQTKSDLFAKIARKIYNEKFPKQFRGIKETDYYELKYTHCPAMIIENLFYDNYNDAQYLNSEQGQKEIASCLAEVVKNIC